MKRRTAQTATGLLLALLLAACTDPGRITVYGAPPDPPPLPPRKPALAEQPRLPSAPRVQAGAAPQAVTVKGGAHRVAAGETLYGIARRYNVPLRTVIDANSLEPPYRLAVGQRLAIPRARVHEVASGETVYGISRAYDVDMAALMQLNDIRPPYAITVGQKLLLPSSGEGEQPQPPGAPTAVAGAPARQLPSQPAPPSSQQGTAARPSATASAPAGNEAAPGRPATRTAAIPQPPARSGGAFLWPVRGKIVSRFGPQGDGRHNDGVNIAASAGAPVLAAENGVVAYAGNELRGFGNLLLVKHDGGWITAYAHNETLLVGRGDTVRRGQPIARVGNSGSVARPQLHFEIRKGTRALDPLDYLERVSAGG